MTELTFDVTLKVAIRLDTSGEKLPKPCDIAISNVGAVGEAVRNTILEHLRTGPDEEPSVFLVEAISDASGSCVASISIEANVALALEPRQSGQSVTLYDTVTKGA